MFSCQNTRLAEKQFAHGVALTSRLPVVEYETAILTLEAGGMEVLALHPHSLRRGLALGGYYRLATPTTLAGMFPLVILGTVDASVFVLGERLTC